MGWRRRTVRTVEPPQATRRCAKGGHGAGAVPPCWWKGPTDSMVRIGEINVGEGRENSPDQTRPTSERGPPALLSESVDRSNDQTGLGMIACEVTQQMEVVGDLRTTWIVLQQER